MPTTMLALQILLILLPGFAAAYVVQMLSSRAAQSDADKVIEALLFSFVIYSAMVLLNQGRLPFSIDYSAKNPTILWDRTELVLLVALTFLFGVALAVYTNHDGNRLFRKIKVTERTSRRSIWNDIFESEASESQVVQVEVDGGRSVIGVLKYYSDVADDCSIYLVQAKWVSEDAEEVDIPGPGILLTKNSGIKSVSFLHPAE